MAVYRVLVADDHPLYRDALSSVVSAAFADVEVDQCEDIVSALEHLRRGAIDLVLLDLSMPDADGLDGLRRLREASPATPVIICSAHNDPQLMRESFRLGVSGYLPKSSGTDVTRHALQLVRSGGVYVPSEALFESVVNANLGGDAGAPTAGGDNGAALTPRQMAVLALLEQGMSNKAIARELAIGEITVKAHVSAILRKLGVDNRVQAVVAARSLRR
ncbi:MAG: response regulator transcription factor [Halieaceae bacterium]|jgi:DNA-binding NarL/FixJ family response regulator|nr:response regulator transcription factor [Halieaceae bacterium]